MAPGRRGSRDSDDDAGPSTSGPRSIGQQVEHIGNKIVRSVKFRALKRKEDKRKKAERKKRQEETQKAIDEGRELPVRQEPKASLMMGVCCSCEKYGGCLSGSSVRKSQGEWNEAGRGLWGLVGLQASANPGH